MKDRESCSLPTYQKIYNRKTPVELNTHDKSSVFECVARRSVLTLKSGEAGNAVELDNVGEGNIEDGGINIPVLLRDTEESPVTLACMFNIFFKSQEERFIILKTFFLLK